MTNFDLCQNIFTILKHCQVETVVICAGARNAALVHHLNKQSFQKIFFFEERSAAFFALGLMKQTEKPVAIITTSGTAVAELLPATIESFYQGLPLILISADRPKQYRNCGAPQTINQVGIFSHYVEQSFDWDIYQNDFNISTQLQSPIHFNICFDEPLIDEPCGKKTEINFRQQKKSYLPAATAENFSQIKKPLIVVSQIEAQHKNEVIDFIKLTNAPVYLEALSQLQHEESISKQVIESSDVMVKKLFQSQNCESLIRIGGIPTLRFWRDLEGKFKDVPVFNFTNLDFAGLSRPTQSYALNFQSMKPISTKNEIQEYKTKDQKLQKIKVELINEFPLSEQAWVHRLSEYIEDQPIYLGNSLPIREWDMFSKHSLSSSSQMIYANRGANGIDGQISTYLGWSMTLKKSWCLVGDLTAMYDLAALGLNQSASPEQVKRVVVMNNFGGQIFKRVFNNSDFLNSHQIEFEMWAKMWKWDYLKVNSLEHFEVVKSMTAAKIIIEIQPSFVETKKFWDAWDQACHSI